MNNLDKQYQELLMTILEYPKTPKPRESAIFKIKFNNYNGEVTLITGKSQYSKTN